jgi:ankyrin repeat protein
MSLTAMLVDDGPRAPRRRPPANALERLWRAAEDGDAEEARRLLDAGADVNGDIGGRSWASTALHEAAHRGHTEVVRLLLSRGANVNATAQELVTPLHLAAMHGHSEARRCAA